MPDRTVRLHRRRDVQAPGAGNGQRGCRRGRALLHRAAQGGFHWSLSRSKACVEAIATELDERTDDLRQITCATRSRASSSVVRLRLGPWPSGEMHRLGGAASPHLVKLLLHRPHVRVIGTELLGCPLEILLQQLQYRWRLELNHGRLSTLVTSRHHSPVVLAYSPVPV